MIYILKKQSQMKKGNKNDLYLEEAISDEEGLKLAKEIDAIYQRTSAKSYL